MHRRLYFAGLAATGGLLTTAFLQVAVAAADISADGADAFTIGNYTFDPFTIGATGGDVEGFDPVAPLSSAPPLLTIGGGDLLGILPVASQNFEVYSPTGGVDLGSINTSETVTNLLGLTNTEFTVIAPADGSVPATDLPAVGSVYDVFNLGNGYENVYTAIPGTTGSDTVTDTLVTPNGDYNLDSLFGSIDAAAPLQPGDALTILGDSALGKDAFTFGGTTFDPYLTDPSTGAETGEGFAPVTSLVSAPPLLNIGGASLGGGFLNTQEFNVYDGTSAGATDVGTVQTGVEVTNLLGLTNTDITVQFVTPASGESASDLPAVGTVYDSFNLGNGYDNVYIATPGSDGTVTDTLVTPYGNVNLDSLFGSINAADPLNPGDAFTGLQTGDSSVGADAFTIGSATFDPQTIDATGADVEGFTPVTSTIGVPPLLNLGGGTPSLDGITLSLAPQDFNVYTGTGTGAIEVGNITTNEDVTQLLGLNNTEFTVTAVTAASGADATDLPTVGSVYDVFNLGDGIENIYTAIPGVAGAADTVTDTLVTPWGDMDLSSLVAGIDAAAALDPGAAFGAGLDVATSAASAVDPLAFLGL